MNDFQDANALAPGPLDFVDNEFTRLLKVWETCFDVECSDGGHACSDKPISPSSAIPFTHPRSQSKYFGRASVCGLC